MSLKQTWQLRINLCNLGKVSKSKTLAFCSNTKQTGRSFLGLHISEKVFYLEFKYVLFYYKTVLAEQMQWSFSE